MRQASWGKYALKETDIISINDKSIFNPNFTGTLKCSSSFVDYRRLNYNFLHTLVESTRKVSQVYTIYHLLPALTVKLETHYWKRVLLDPAQTTPLTNQIGRQ